MNDRKKFIGGSEIASILNLSPYTTAWELWSYKTGKKEKKDISNLPHVRRGIDNEPIVRNMINTMMGRNFEERKFSDNDYGFIKGSLDGYDEKSNSFIEIKCMGKENHSRAKLGIIPKHYYCQIQWYYHISGASVGYFVSYYPEKDDITYFIVDRDEGYIDSMISKAKEFWESNIVGNKEPEDGKPNPNSTIKEVLELSQEYSRLKQKEKMLKVEMDSIKEKIKSYGDIENEFIKAKLVQRKGRINYKKFLEDNSLSASSDYRSKPIESYTITVR